MKNIKSYSDFINEGLFSSIKKGIKNFTGNVIPKDKDRIFGASYKNTKTRQPTDEEFMIANTAVKTIGKKYTMSSIGVNVTLGMIEVEYQVPGGSERWAEIGFDGTVLDTGEYNWGWDE